MEATRYVRRAIVLAVMLLLPACGEQGLTDPAPAPELAVPDSAGPPPVHPGEATRLRLVECRASVASATVLCGAPASAGIAADVIVGGQGTYVQLTSSNVAYNIGTGQFTFNVTLQNLIDQPLGTSDGVVVDPAGIRIFFQNTPTVTDGTGSVAVVPDGFATFLAAGQPYYSYPYLLAKDQVSAAETWTFIMPPTVESFEFSVYVSAPVQWPDGYIELDGQLPGSSYGGIHPSTTHGLTAVLKNAVGAVVTGPAVTFTTDDPLCATVDGAGLVTPVRAATCAIRAESGDREGSLLFDVSGMERIWAGTAGSDWETGASWVGGLVPAAEDSVYIPLAPGFPVLSQDRQVAGVRVEDNAALSIGAFNLTVTANVLTGTGDGSGILGGDGFLILAGTGRSLAGRVPRVAVTGSYELSGNVTASGRMESRGGRLNNALFQYYIGS